MKIIKKYLPMSRRAATRDKVTKLITDNYYRHKAHGYIVYYDDDEEEYVTDRGMIPVAHDNKNNIWWYIAAMQIPLEMELDGQRVIVTFDGLITDCALPLKIQSNNDETIYFTIFPYNDIKIKKEVF